MSFLSTLKRIAGIGAQIEHIAVPILSIADPALIPVLSQIDGWVTRTNAAVVSAEHTITDAKSGGLKQAAVIQDFQDGIETAQSALAVVGKTMQYNVDEYKKVIDSFTAAYNAAAAFKQTWKIVDLPQAGAPTA